MQLDYLVAKFKYNAEKDSYTCPQGGTLKTTERWQKKWAHRTKRVSIIKIPIPSLQVMSCKTSL
jgi:hypothetical protein